MWPSIAPPLRGVRRRLCYSVPMQVGRFYFSYFWFSSAYGGREI